jgi:hypothetical protein
MQLRLVHGRGPEPNFDLPEGRPGDWSEPIHVESLDFALVASRASSLEVSPHLLAAALVERALLINDLANSELLAVLDEDAERPRPTPGPGASLQSYVRDLRNGSAASRDRRSDGALVIPLRLHHELNALSGADLDVAHADQALRWEIAAACDGRLMREWGLLVALRSLA